MRGFGLGLRLGFPCVSGVGLGIKFRTACALTVGLGFIIGWCWLDCEILVDFKIDFVFGLVFEIGLFWFEIGFRC